LEERDATRVGAHAEEESARECAVDFGRECEYRYEGVALFDQLPEVWALLRPRRGCLNLGFVLMTINRLSGRLLPGLPENSDANNVLASTRQNIASALG